MAYVQKNPFTQQYDWKKLEVEKTEEPKDAKISTASVEESEHDKATASERIV